MILKKQLIASLLSFVLMCLAPLAAAHTIRFNNQTSSYIQVVANRLFKAHALNPGVSTVWSDDNLMNICQANLDNCQLDFSVLSPAGISGVFEMHYNVTTHRVLDEYIYPAYVVTGITTHRAVSHVTIGLQPTSSKVIAHPQY